MPSSRCGLRSTIATVAFAVAATLWGGCTADKHFSQAQLDAIQSRQLDVPAERAYRAVIGALLQEEYQIIESDMEGGLLVAREIEGNSWDGYSQSLVQIAVTPTGPSSSSVRISTSSGGQTRVDESRISLLHRRIDL
ncbi:MAG: hypothetical protein ACYTGC_17905, partial [Planctomycetota bacterium]